MSTPPEGPHPYMFLAAPMTGLPELNLPAIRAAIALLEKAVITAFNPYTDMNFEDYVPPASHSAEGNRWLQRDLNYVMDARCAGVIAMEGWRESFGAYTEVWIGQRFGKNALEYRLAPTLSPGFALIAVESLH